MGNDVTGATAVSPPQGDCSVFEAKRLCRLFAVLLALALVASACGGGGDNSESESASSSDGSSDSSSESDDGPDEVEADGGPDEVDADDTGADKAADGAELQTEDDAATGPVAGGTLRYGFESDPSTLNPTSAPFASGADLIGVAIFDTIVVWDEDENWVNNLSESFTPNDDFTSWDMKLHEGILFHDDSPLNADAVIRNLQGQQASPLLGLFYGPLFDPDNPYEKVDDLTVRIRPNGPNSVLPGYFASQLGMMASPAWFDAIEADPSLEQMPVGSGPFVMESRQQDQVTRVVRNDNWWRSDAEIYLDAVEFFPLQQEATRTDQLLTGDLDVIHVTDNSSIGTLRNDDSILRVERSNEDFFLIFNAGKAPFDDLRVREAATAAFPREVYAEFIQQGIGVATDSLFPPSSRWHDSSIVQGTDDPATAEALVGAYCADVPESCTDGKVNIEYQNNGPSLTLEEVYSVISDGWAPFFNIEHQVIPQDEHINEVVFGLFDVATWRYHGFLDPGLEEFFFSCSTIGALSINFGRNCSPERDALLLEQRTTTDQATREETWRRIQADLNDSRQYLLITHVIWTTGANDNVNGLCDVTTITGDKIICGLRGVNRVSSAWLG
ncbi:MAG: peptide/nickel transport system substrate-binding protein [Verrucomicrobiales bacterium]